MINLKDIVSNYTKGEKSAFALGLLYGHAKDLMNNESFNGYKVEELMQMILNENTIINIK